MSGHGDGCTQSGKWKYCPWCGEAWPEAPSKIAKGVTPGDEVEALPLGQIAAWAREGLTLHQMSERLGRRGYARHAFIRRRNREYHATHGEYGSVDEMDEWLRAQGAGE